MSDKNYEANPSHTAPDSSPNSGSYNPGPFNPVTDDAEPRELSYVEAQKKDIMLEEFPEGPYGAATNEDTLGKSTPWKPGQRSISVDRDQNPVFSNRKTPLHEPSTDGAPLGTIEGQN